MSTETNAHTPAPWVWDKSRGVVYICLRSGKRIAQMIVGDMLTNEEDATHIVCCVNAWDDAAALRARLAELETTIFTPASLDRAPSLLQ